MIWYNINYISCRQYTYFSHISHNISNVSDINSYIDSGEHSVLVLAGGGVAWATQGLTKGSALGAGPSIARKRGSPLFSKARAAVLPSDELMAAGKPRMVMKTSGCFMWFCYCICLKALALNWISPESLIVEAGVCPLLQMWWTWKFVCTPPLRKFHDFDNLKAMSAQTPLHPPITQQYPTMNCCRACWRGLHDLSSVSLLGGRRETTWTSKEYEEYEQEQLVWMKCFGCFWLKDGQSISINYNCENWGMSCHVWIRLIGNTTWWETDHSIPYKMRQSFLNKAVLGAEFACLFSEVSEIYAAKSAKSNTCRRFCNGAVGWILSFI